MNDQSISFSPKQIDTLIQSEKLFILYVHCVIVTVKGPGTRPMLHYVIKIQSTQKVFHRANRVNFTTRKHKVKLDTKQSMKVQLSSIHFIQSI